MDASAISSVTENVQLKFLKSAFQILFTSTRAYKTAKLVFRFDFNQTPINMEIFTAVLESDKNTELETHKDDKGEHEKFSDLTTIARDCLLHFITTTASP